MRNLLSLLLLSSTFFVFSQEGPPIQADRPDQTETPYLVPSKMFQVETGFTFERSKGNIENFILPTVLWKYGINEIFELRLITEIISVNKNSENYSGFQTVLIGCKIKISEEKGIFPKTGFISHLGLPNLASKEFKTKYYAPEFRFVMQHTLTQKISLSYNLGAEWDGFSALPTFIYSISGGFSLTEKLGCYTEFYGFAPQKNIAEHNFDAGFTYLLNHDFMIDISSGIGISNSSLQHYVALGFSFRI